MERRQKIFEKSNIQRFSKFYKTIMQETKQALEYKESNTKIHNEIA